MDSLKAFIEENKTRVMIGAILVLFFVAFSVASFVHTQSVREAQELEEALEEAAAESSEEAEAEDSLTEEQEAVEDQLSDELKAKRDSYDSDTKEFIAILTAQLWGVDGGSPYISFTDTTYSETTESGDTETHAYVIHVLKKTTEQSSDPEILRYTAAVETEEASFFIELTRETDTDGTVTYYLSSSAFRSSSSSYVSVSVSGAYEVTGLNDEVLALIGNDLDGLNDAVSRYCAQYYPTASDIVWANYVVISWETNQITIPFQEGNSVSSLISVVYDRDTQTFTVE